MTLCYTRTDYKGVRLTDKGRYAVNASLYGCNRYLGQYDTITEAVRRHDLAILASGGKRSRLNDPEARFSEYELRAMSDHISAIVTRKAERKHKVTSSYARDNPDNVELDLSEYDAQISQLRQTRLTQALNHQARLTLRLKTAPQHDSHHHYQNSDGYSVSPFSNPIALF